MFALAGALGIAAKGAKSLLGKIKAKKLNKTKLPKISKKAAKKLSKKQEITPPPPPEEILHTDSIETIVKKVNNDEPAEKGSFWKGLLSGIVNQDGQVDLKSKIKLPEFEHKFELDDKAKKETNKLTAILIVIASILGIGFILKMLTKKSS